MLDLRYGHGCIRIIICVGDDHALGLLLVCASWVVLNVRCLGVDIVGFEICDGWEVRMCGGTVIALVVVVGGDLPVVVGVDLPSVVKFVVVKVVVVKSFLLINTFEFLFPADFWSLLRVQVDPDESIAVDTSVDWQQTVLGLVETGKILVPRCFGKLAVETVGPAVVSAREDLVGAFRFGYDRESTVPAHVVECVDVTGSVSRNNECESCNVETNPVTGVLDSDGVGDDLPSS